MVCPRCAEINPESASYCAACGHRIATVLTGDDTKAGLWKQFIGPGADHYLERFRVFQTGGTDHFALTWHWPAFGLGWLWYLYRKMYLHSAVFLVGGLLPMFLGAGLIGAVLWNIFAAVAANFLYYMHIKLSLSTFQQRAGTDLTLRDRLIADAGGTQPYVWWLGAGLMALALGAGVMGVPSPFK